MSGKIPATGGAVEMHLPSAVVTCVQSGMTNCNNSIWNAVEDYVNEFVSLLEEYVLNVRQHGIDSDHFLYSTVNHCALGSYSWKNIMAGSLSLPDALMNWFSTGTVQPISFTGIKKQLPANKSKTALKVVGQIKQTGTVKKPVVNGRRHHKDRQSRRGLKSITF
eukprot:TRINITY_DN3924_c0_g2_i1.p1 TRINITY_DN3924_c0_g2~~TRINITY_DN3924_c0_g2_i1.p1  ORF type:complete len:164 (+),score=30.54 TRINITY_DN3924_c0_g2_i1:193-684(+)